MNDRYLYKGKDKDDGKWYEGYYLLLHDTTYCCMPSDNIAETKRLDDENTHHYIVFEQMTDWGLPNKHLRAEILPETLCQCTGVPDKDMTIIYENDIVRDESGVRGIVQFGRYGDKKTDYGFYIKWDKCQPYWRNDIYYWNRQIRVIGSAIDNPELLEAGKEAGDHGDQDFFMPAT